jgi:hypothetical protein
MAKAYYLSPNKDLRGLGRVALVEMASASSSPDIAAAITDALFLESQKKQVFGVMVVHRDDPTWQNLQENLDSLQALRQLVAAREALNCNGLLLDLTDGQLFWGMEQVWDSADRSIQKRIRTYLKEGRRAGESPLREELVVVSPLTFCKFVAYEVAGTLDRARKK